MILGIDIDDTITNTSKVVNKYLRQEIKKVCDRHQLEFHVPNILYCTDNAAMIASAAHYNYICGKSFDIKDKLDLNAIANLKIGE